MGEHVPFSQEMLEQATAIKFEAEFELPGISGEPIRAKGEQHFTIKREPTDTVRPEPMQKYLENGWSVVYGTLTSAPHLIAQKAPKDESLVERYWLEQEGTVVKAYFRIRNHFGQRDGWLLTVNEDGTDEFVFIDKPADPEQDKRVQQKAKVAVAVGAATLVGVTAAKLFIHRRRRRN